MARITVEELIKFMRISGIPEDVIFDVRGPYDYWLAQNYFRPWETGISKEQYEYFFKYPQLVDSFCWGDEPCCRKGEVSWIDVFDEEKWTPEGLAILSSWLKEPLITPDEIEWV